MTLVAVAVAAAGALALGGLSLTLGPKLGYVDLPDDPLLKAHQRPAVPLGGLGVFVGVHAALAIAGEFDTGLLLASAMVLVLGLVDDRVGVAPGMRLIIEVAAAVVLVVSSVSADWVFALAAVGLVVVSINAVNLFDGLDGLVGLAGLVAGLGLWWLGDLRGLDGTFGLVLAAALGGFLLLNWYPAKVFLGDNGSYVVGLFLAHGVILATPDGSVAGLGVAAGLLGVFAFDLVVTVVRRGLNRRPLLRGDRGHLYDQFMARGWSVRRVALTAALLQAGFVVLAGGVDQAIGRWGGVVALIAGWALLLGLAAAGGFLSMDVE